MRWCFADTSSEIGAKDVHLCCEGNRGVLYSAGCPIRSRESDNLILPLHLETRAAREVQNIPVSDCVSRQHAAIAPGHRLLPLRHTLQLLRASNSHAEEWSPSVTTFRSTRELLQVLDR